MADAPTLTEDELSEILRFADNPERWTKRELCDRLLKAARALRAANDRVAEAEKEQRHCRNQWQYADERADKAEAKLAERDRELARVKAKAEQYEKDWIEAKYEFGSNIARVRADLAAAKEEIERLKAELQDRQPQAIRGVQTAWRNYEQYDTDDHPEVRHQAWLKLCDELRSLEKTK